MSQHSSFKSLDEENKAPITRVFNLNGLRKASQRSLDSTNNERSIQYSGDFIDSTKPIEKKVYNVGDFRFSKKLVYKNDNENIELASPTSSSASRHGSLVTTPMSPTVPEQKQETNVLIEQHKSEIDIDDKYVSKKMNPVYKSDSEDESDYKAIDNMDFGDYNYQDPSQLHGLNMNEFNRLSVKSNKMQNNNLSVIQVSTSEATTPNDDEIYATINEDDLYLTPVELKLDASEANKSLKENYIKELKADMMRESVIVKVSHSVLRHNIAIVCVYETLWVAGLSSTNVSKSLYRHLYIGDIIVAINNDTVNNIYELNAIVDKYKSTSLHLRIKRLPYARAIFISKEHLPIIPSANTIASFDGKYAKHVKSILGIKLETNKPRIEKIEENGIVYKSGLKYNPNRFTFDIALTSQLMNNELTDDKNRFTTWMFTEINGNPINLSSHSEDVAALLFTTKDNEICFLVQPTDLIKTLLKELKKKYQNWKNYVIG